ncbi:MAG TPA: tripartite tricarboxylate transporter substrate-binding protein, partial [Bordetella sp.]|nr:tripartite tricarboxylate transporter substrate-binding protein [Bordetella sp.]
AVGSDQRSGQVPDVPTLLESGYDVHGETWYGLLVSKNTPQDAFDGIVAGIRHASQDRELVERIKSDGGEPVFSTPEAFTQEVRDESRRLDTLLDKYWTAQ